MVRNESKWAQPVRDFFSTTTLHGFKYLFSAYYMDRVAWLIWCCASTFCAGLVCTVLWSRFLEVPAVLELWDLQTVDTEYQLMPLVALCPPLHATTDKLLDTLKPNVSVAEEARKTLGQVLANNIHSVSPQQLRYLEALLSENNMSITELVQNNLPSCAHMMLKCRWRHVMMPCGSLFENELTPWGVCCVMRSMQSINGIRYPIARTTELDVTLHCSSEQTQSCRFFSAFELDITEQPMVIVPGYNYLAQAKCAQQICGCVNPLLPKDELLRNTLPPCSVTQMNCLRAHQNDSMCYCMPSCNKVTTFVTMESGRMEVLKSALDPLYYGINVTSSVLHLKLYNKLSRIFTMNPTESWLSLLSSLGGVFNMFLGVGLFSALEILFLLFIKLPIAFKDSSEIVNLPSSKY